MIEAYYIGMDIGGTRVKSCLIDPLHNVIVQRNIETRSDLGQEVVLNDVCRLINDYKKDYNNLIIGGVGIGICGPVDSDKGTLITSPILVGWQKVNVSQIIHRQTGLSCVLENDANVAVYAEHRLGAAKGSRNVIGFTLGTGIGGGVILNGALYRGSHNFAGELGHITVQPNGRECPCGNKGCLNVEASALAVKERYAALVASKTPVEGISYQDILNYAKENDETALLALNPSINALAIGVASMINAFDPDYVILFGGPTNTGQWFLRKIKASVQHRIFPFLFRRVKIRYSKYQDMAGAIGAALLAETQL